MKKNLLLICLTTCFLSIYAQEPQDNIRKSTFLQYDASTTVKRDLDFYWVGWNFVEKRDVFRPKNPKDTMYFYMGLKKEGVKAYEMYEVVPRKGATIANPTIFALNQIYTKISNATMNAPLNDTDESANEVKCKLKILQTYALLYCDKDKYPAEKKLTEDYIDRQWAALVKYKSGSMKTIAKMMDLPPGASPNYEEKYVIYDFLKKFDAFDFVKEGKKYNFSMVALVEEVPMIISGKISAEGIISETKRAETEFPACGK